MAQFELANRIELKNPYINLDYYYGPYLVNAFPEVPDTGLNIDTQQAQRLVFNQAENNVVQPESSTASSLSDLLNAAALKCGYGDGADSAGRTIALAVSSGTKYKVKEYWLNDGKWVEKNKEPQEIDLTGYWKYSDTAFLLEEKLSNGSISKTCYTIQYGEITETVYTAKPGDVLRKLHIDGYLGGDYFLENATIDGNTLEFPGTLEDLNDLTGYVIYRGDLYRYNIPAQEDFNQEGGTWEIGGWEKVTIPNNYVVYVGNNLWIPLTPSITANEGDIITEVKTSNDGTIQVTKKPLEVSEGDIITDISVESSKIQVTKKPITVTGEGDTVKSVQFDENGLTVEKDNILDHVADQNYGGHEVLYIDSNTAPKVCTSSKKTTVTLSANYYKRLPFGNRWDWAGRKIFCYSQDLKLDGKFDLTKTGILGVTITITTQLTQPDGSEETIINTFADCNLTENSGNLTKAKSSTDSTQIIVGKYKYDIVRISENLYNLTLWLYASEIVSTSYITYTGLNLIPSTNSLNTNTLGDSATIKFEFTLDGRSLFTGSQATTDSNRSAYISSVFTRMTTGVRNLIRPIIPKSATRNSYGGIKARDDTSDFDWTDSANNQYALAIDSDGRGYVTVPAATSTTFGTIKATNNATDDSTGTKYPLKIDTSGNGYVTVPAGGGTTVPIDLTRLFKACNFDLEVNKAQYIHVAHIERKNDNWEQITLLVQGAHYSTNAQVGLINISGGKQKVFTLWFPKNQSLYENVEYDKESDFYNNSVFYLKPANNTTGPWDLYMHVSNTQKGGSHHVSVQILSDPDECVTLKMDTIDSLPSDAILQPKYSIRPISGSHINVSRKNEISLDNSSIIKNDTAKIADNNYGFIKIAEVTIPATAASQGIRGTLLVASKPGWNDTNNAGSAIITWTINQNNSGNSIGVSAVQLPGYASGQFATVSSGFFVKSAGDEYEHKIEFYAKKGGQWHSCNVIAFDKYTTIVKSNPGLTNISSADTLADNAIFYLTSNIGKYKKIPVCVINPGTATTYDGLNSDNFVTENNLKSILSKASYESSEGGNSITIPPNYSDWYRGLFVKKTTDLNIDPQLWYGSPNGTYYTLLGSRGHGAIGSPDLGNSNNTTTPTHNLAIWANNIQLYSSGSEHSQDRGTIAVDTNGLTYNKRITASAFYESSDKRLKDTSDYDLSLDQILSIPLVDFTWKDKRDLKHHLGTIAQDVQEVVPEIVEEDKDGMLTVEYDKFGILAIEAIRQLKDIVDKQAKEIEELKAKIK